MPWKPVMTATSPASREALSASAGTPVMRAEPCAVLVSTGICQPCHERALMPMDCSTMAVRPAVTCSPLATTASYSRLSCSCEASLTQATSWLVAPAMAETTTATLLPASTSRLTWRATFLMRSTLATDVPPNFITTTAMATPPDLTLEELENCALGAHLRRKDQSQLDDPHKRKIVNWMSALS